MRVTVLLPIALTATLVLPASAAPLPVTLRDGRAHVAASALEREAGIVIKKLPGRGEFVACGAEQCALLKSVLAEGDILLVPVAGLSEALNLSASFDDSRRHVALVPAPRESSAATGTARVGSVAPNLHLIKLDGTPVSLDELRARAARQPADADMRLALAQALERSGDYAAALAECESAARLRPGDAPIPFTHGLVLLRQGRTNDALVQFTRARDHDPGNWRIRKQIWALEHPDKFYGAQGIDCGPGGPKRP